MTSRQVNKLFAIAFYILWTDIPYRTMRGFIKFFAVIPLLAAMLCCQPDTVEQDIIARAEALMPSRPDSALLLLRQISPRQSTPQHADWCALRVWAEYRTYQPETDESALQTAFNYYASRDNAARNKVDMRMYRVIYDAIDEIEAAMKGMLAPKFEEVVIGHAEVRMTYKVSSIGTVAGCFVKDGKITSGHARAILGLDDENQMILLANKVCEKDLSVREVEKTVRTILATKDVEILKEKDDATVQRRVYMKDLERRAMDTLGRRVKINQTAKKKTVELTFDSDSDLEELLCLLCGDNFFKI